MTSATRLRKRFRMCVRFYAPRLSPLLFRRAAVDSSGKWLRASRRRKTRGTRCKRAWRSLGVNLSTD